MLFSAALSTQRVDRRPSWRARELLLVDPRRRLRPAVRAAEHARRRTRAQGTGVVSVLRNVTDLRARDARRSRRTTARCASPRRRCAPSAIGSNLIIDSVADPIIVTDPAGDIVLMNAPAERLFTVPPTADARTRSARVQANDAHFSSFVSERARRAAGEQRVGARSR